MSYRTVIFEQNYHWLLVELFFFSKFVWIWLLILHARIQALKESRVVAMESFLIELIKAIEHKCSKQGVFEILDEFTKKYPHRNTTSDNWAKPKDWRSIDITNFDGSELDFLTSQFGLSQMIKDRDIYSITQDPA